jgi:EmrB/QacA subfamily drug resistance transporter
MTTPALGGRRTTGILLLVCVVQFMDVVDAAILNVALPSIERSLDFTQQNLQWVISGYLVSYGGFLLLGGRASDLLGRRRMLVAGATLFALFSLAGALAPTGETLVIARIAQGVGAALMAPAGLSILMTTFRGPARNKALGVWGAMSGLGAAAGIFFGGVLTQGPGWRWVLLVNIPIGIAMVVAALRLLARDHPERREGRFDLRGAVLVTAAMLLGLHALIEAPLRGWATARTIGELMTAGLLLVVFVANELRVAHPLFPLSLLRIRGIAAADLIQLAAFGGFTGSFFFLTLYMQNVLGFSPIQGGAAYLPVTAVLVVTAGISSVLVGRTGTRPIIVVSALVASGGLFLLSRIPVDGTYTSDLLPGLLVMGVGVGALLVTVTSAANAGVPHHQAGLAAGLLNTSQQLGTALAIAVFSAVATSHTNHLLASGDPVPDALTGGYSRAVLGGAIFVATAALIGFLAPNTHAVTTTPALASDDAELSDDSESQRPDPTRRPEPALTRTSEHIAASAEPPATAQPKGRTSMRYLLQVRFHAAPDITAPPSDHERDDVRAQYLRIRQHPSVLDAHQLQPADTATTVRVNAGKVDRAAAVPVAHDDALDGYYLLEAPDIDAAVAFAAQIPAAASGGTVEIRPVLG